MVLYLCGIQEIGVQFSFLAQNLNEYEQQTNLRGKALYQKDVFRKLIKWWNGIRSPGYGDGVKYGNTDSYGFNSRFNHKNAIVA